MTNPLEIFVHPLKQGETSLQSQYLSHAKTIVKFDPRC